MDNGTKIQRDYNIPTDEYNSSNNVVLSMEECLANSKECTLTDEGQDNKMSMIAYHIINNIDANIKQEFNYFKGNIFPINITNFVQNKKCTILKQKITKSHRAIAPKFVDVNGIKVKRNVCVESKKRKDDKRRATHNEIERRRRSKINNCIFKLKELIPEVKTLNSSSEMNCKNASTDSKSQILFRAYDYIQHMQEELNSLRECVKENEQLRLINQDLHHKINELQNQVP